MIDASDVRIQSKEIYTNTRWNSGQEKKVQNFHYIY